MRRDPVPPISPDELLHLEPEAPLGVPTIALLVELMNKQNHKLDLILQWIRDREDDLK